jgi:hypothetical protein
VIVFNQKVRDAQPGVKGKLAGILKSSVLVEVDGKFVTVHTVHDKIQQDLLDLYTIPHNKDCFRFMVKLMNARVALGGCSTVPRAAKCRTSTG